MRLHLKKAFKAFVVFLKREDLISSETLGVDGTKMRARNNKRIILMKQNLPRL